MSNDLVALPKEPWSRQPAENDIEYAVFSAFRDTPPLERPSSQAILAAKFGIGTDEIKLMAAKHGWASRTIKYDVWLEASTRAGALAQRRELGAKMVTFGKALLGRAERAFQDLEKTNPTYHDAVEMAKLAIELQKSGFTAQGIKDGQGEVSEGDMLSGPADMIEQAMEIQAIIIRKTRGFVIPKNDEAIDGEFTETEADN